MENGGDAVALCMVMWSLGLVGLATEMVDGGV